ncbi:MAG: DNA polymerase III subunit delta [Defluviitaleaceae bacterium]|nr:DNA polymerase III subunit delta [Defluviitaleaceae bacterium]
MQDIKNDFKTGQFKPVYLLYGEELFLVRHYANLFLEKLVSEKTMNSDVFDGKDFEISAVIDAADTFPFLDNNRIVYIKDSNLLSTGRKDDTEKLTKYLPNIPKSTIIVFVETAVDKRNRLYKQVAAQGRAIEFQTPSDSELTKWLANIFKKNGKQISAPLLQKILSTVPKGMDAIYSEADKIADFLGDRTTVTETDIDEICTKSLEARIFDLVAAVCNGQTEKALVLYHNMLVAKEQPIVILVMMARQFRLVLQCKSCADQKMQPRQIAATLALRDFIVRECLQQAKKFTQTRLVSALLDCQDTDHRIKTGLITAELGVELLIVQYSINNV